MGKYYGATEPIQQLETATQIDMLGDIILVPARKFIPYQFCRVAGPFLLARAYPDQLGLDGVTGVIACVPACGKSVRSRPFPAGVSIARQIPDSARTCTVGGTPAARNRYG